MNTCSFAGINSFLHNLWLTDHLSKNMLLSMCLQDPLQKWVVPYFSQALISWRLFSTNWWVAPTASKSLSNFWIREEFGLRPFQIGKGISWNNQRVFSRWISGTWIKMFEMFFLNLWNVFECRHFLVVCCTLLLKILILLWINGLKGGSHETRNETKLSFWNSCWWIW